MTTATSNSAGYFSVVARIRDSGLRRLFNLLPERASLK